MPLHIIDIPLSNTQVIVQAEAEENELSFTVINSITYRPAHPTLTHPLPFKSGPKGTNLEVYSMMEWLPPPCPTSSVFFPSVSSRRQVSLVVGEGRGVREMGRLKLLNKFTDVFGA